MEENRLHWFSITHLLAA